jgi:hypothetical protein
MKAHRPLLTKFMTLVVGLALCGIPERAQAWSQDNGVSPQNGQQQQQSGATGQPQQQNGATGQQQQQSGTTVDPSQGPLQPVPSQSQPNPPSAQPNQSPETAPAPLPATPAPQPKPEQQMQQPLGAATAEGVPVVGGGASRPAGAAIAPAKQNQRRSLLIKLGVIAAVGVAGGTVYALSKGTSSHP